MTKLYHGPEGKGWQIPGQQDRKAERLDVPSSPADLAAWLNARHVPPTDDPLVVNAPEFLRKKLELNDELLAELEARPLEEARPMVPGHCDACGRSTPAP
jgi:hypothetical protein